MKKDNKNEKDNKLHKQNTDKEYNTLFKHINWKCKNKARKIGILWIAKKNVERTVGIEQRSSTGVPRHTDVTQRVRRCAQRVWGEGRKEGRKKFKNKKIVEVNFKSTVYIFIKGRWEWKW
jgi:hypothetical protein